MSPALLPTATFIISETPHISRLRHQNPERHRVAANNRASEHHHQYQHHLHLLALHTGST